MPSTRVGMIDVEGSNAFITATTQALLMLAQTSAWWEVRRYLGKVKEAARSGMRAYDTPPTYEVGQATWTAHITWYASTIGHDTYHSYLYHQAGYRSAQVPDDAWTGADAERQCNEFQLRVLNELHADASLTTYLQGIMNSGTNYYSNYAARNW